MISVLFLLFSKGLLLLSIFFRSFLFILDDLLPNFFSLLFVIFSVSIMCTFRIDIFL